MTLGTFAWFLLRTFIITSGGLKTLGSHRGGDLYKVTDNCMMMMFLRGGAARFPMWVQAHPYRATRRPC